MQEGEVLLMFKVRILLQGRLLKEPPFLKEVSQIYIKKLLNCTIYLKTQLKAKFIINHNLQKNCFYKQKDRFKLF